MAHRRRPFSGLLRVLQNAVEPVYVLDEQRRVAFANDACLAWVGLPWNELFGRTCLYQTPMEPSGPEAIAAALAAPPRTERGESTEDLICLPSGSPRPRRATFLPLRLGEGNASREARPAGILVIVEATDPPEERDSPLPSIDWQAQPDDAQWHLWVQRAVREAALHHGIEQLVARSPAMRWAVRQVEAAEASRANVLFVGPPGSRLEQIAMAAHFGTEPDAAGALVPIDCAVLDDDMIRSSIRAVAAGAAVGRAAGRSTLLLLRIDLLSEPWQRCVWEEIRGPRFPLRVMATVERRDAASTFKELILPELLATIAAIVVSIPPLAERREDIPLLAQFFLERCNAAGQKQVERFSPEALDLLDHYHWPGDAAELEEFVRQAHARAQGTAVAPADLPRRIQWTLDAHRRRPRRPPIQLDAFLRQAEKELISRALRLARGNRAKTARLLGISRPRLYRRMILLGLADPGELVEAAGASAPDASSARSSAARSSASASGREQAQSSETDGSRKLSRRPRPLHAEQRDQQTPARPEPAELGEPAMQSSEAAMEPTTAADHSGEPPTTEAVEDNGMPIFEEAEPPTEPEE